MTASLPRFVLVALGCLLLGLGACRAAPAPPPPGLAGLRFGDAPGPELVAIRVPLPSALADSLAYRTRPGPAGSFHGQALVEPVFAFLRGRLFSVAAFLADPGGEATLVRELEAAYGSPLAGSGRRGGARLWRVGAVDIVLDRPGPERVRLLVRERELARELADWREQDLGLEHDGIGR